MIVYPVAGNVAKLRNGLTGDEFATWELGNLHRALTYRVESIRLASKYRKLLGLRIQDCGRFDIESWGERAFEQVDVDNAIWKTFEKCHAMISKSGRFARPMTEEGSYTNKLS